MAKMFLFALGHRKILKKESSLGLAMTLSKPYKVEKKKIINYK